MWLTGRRNAHGEKSSLSGQGKQKDCSYHSAPAFLKGQSKHALDETAHDQKKPT